MTHPQQAHSELIHTYLDLIGKEADRILQMATPWHPANEVPQDGRYIVRTKEGNTYFLGPVNGKWMDNVEKWMIIPE